MEATNTYGVFSPSGSKTHPSYIRFISSDYRELFKIPDGANIKITYPPRDGREERVRSCHYIDDHHFRINGEAFHIAEFAERMEALGARYEPEVQLKDAELSPFAAEEVKFYTYNREEGNACVGHLSGDFGRDGHRFHNGWYNHKTREEADWSGVTPDFQADLHRAVYALRQSLLKDYGAMLAYCQSHPEAKLPDRGSLEHYGFKLDTKNRQYFILCDAEQTSHGSRFIIYAYNNTLVRERAKPSVLKQIHDTQNTPKKPRKAKSPDRKKEMEGSL
jgi:hypothetical protein